MWCQRFCSHFINRRCFSKHTSTIFALSSGQGKCGVAVIRVSGPRASSAVWEMTESYQLPEPRLAVLKHIYDPKTMEKLDRGLILWFPGPKSFTGEDCCEFQVHGGPAVVSSVLSAMEKLEGFRLAEPGEFTKRAFFNGKLDLIEIEGLGDLIHAETEMQRKQALLQMEGTLSKLYNKWRTILLQNVAHIEAFIDFSEDENIENAVIEEATKELITVRKEIEKHLADGRKGERLRLGVKTTIVGQPNAGKSSLFNSLCNRPAAIVTPIPGTTRDLIEVHINVSGYPVILTDTAGLRNETSDLVEIEGISRAHSVIKESDLLIIMVDSTELQPIIKRSVNQLKKNQDALNLFLIGHIQKLNINSFTELKHGLPEDKTEFLKSKEIIFVLNKIDLLNDKTRSNLMKAADQNIICLSCTTGEGLQNLIKVLSSRLMSLCGSPSAENPVLTQVRHRHHLSQCCYYIDQYFTMTGLENIPIAAHQIRKSLTHLGKITGEVRSDEILDIIFKDFCIALIRNFSSPAVNDCLPQVPSYIFFNENFQDEEIKIKFLNDMKVYENYITPQEEQILFDEIEPVMKRQRYEKHHWDDAITGYRETEKPNWNEFNRKIIEKTKKLAFGPGTNPLKCVHVLDLKPDGVIKPHVDSIKFCGNTIAGISLLSDSVMRMRLDKERHNYIDVLLKRRSLYIMKDSARYDFAHEILANQDSTFGSNIIVKSRRISLICRNEP